MLECAKLSVQFELSVDQIIAISRPNGEVDSSIPARFREVVRCHGHRDAIRTERLCWTYAQLNARANQIAHALLAREFDRSLPVALLLPVDAPLIASVLGVLKAGGFYAALEPGSHHERAQSFRTGSGAPLAMVSAETAPWARQLGWEESALLYIDEVDGFSVSDPDLDVSSDAFAMVLYTSGSTGAAKGVVHSHRNVSHLSRCFDRTVRPSPDDRISWAYNPGTMGGIRVFFPTLLCGGCLCLWDVRTTGFAGLRQLVQREALTILHLPVTVFRQFVADLAPAEQFPSVRMVMLGGESSGPDCLEAFKRHFPVGARLNVGYGSSETGRPCENFADHESTTGDRIPVGYVSEGFEVAIVDAEGQELATGQSGELVIRSPYLARGYWTAGALDTEKFNPYPAGTPERSFRTSDIAVVNPDGKVEVLGRLDSRVKIRSLWTDLWIIEQTLLKVRGVRHAVVVVCRQVGQADTLAAWLVTEGERPGDAELRAELILVLPQEAVPDYFYEVQEFPRNDTGKTDRRLLAAWASERCSQPSACHPEAPSSGEGLESELTRIWKRLLGVAAIPRDSDFFALGGHSLLAVRVISEIQKQLGHEVPLAAFLRHATIAQLARLIEGAEPKTHCQSLVPIQEKGSHPPLFLVHGIGGGVLSYRSLARYLGEDQPVYGLQAVSLGGAPREYDRMEEMAAHYLREMREVQPKGPYFLGGLSFGGKVALEIARRLLAEGEQVALLAFFDTRAPGYPKYLPPLPRAIAHLKNLSTLSRAEQYEYLRVRLVSAIDNLRRRMLTKHYRHRASQGIDQVLDDIGIAHLHAGRVYAPEKYAGVITLFRAEMQPVGSVFEPCIGWEALAAQVITHPVPGHHLSILEEPHLAVLAKRLAACLAEARSGRVSD